MTSDDHLLPGATRKLKDRQRRAFDFGRITRRVPEAVATPRSVEEVAKLVRGASRDGVRLAIRGGGHSQGGQSLTDRGVVLHTSSLDRIQRAGPELIRAQGGARWGDVVDALRGAERLPPVLPDIADVTVGGTLSAGGVGTTSHRHGMQVGQVEQLDVVTGTGERVRCSPTRNHGLFDAVRGGQGQFGIITEAWIRLRAAGPRFRQYELHYRDHDRFADDLEFILDVDRFDHLRAELRRAEGVIVLNAGFEYGGEPNDGEMLDSLGYHENVFTRDTANVGRAGMWPSWGFSWLHYHPWRDWLLPWDALPTLIAQPWVDSISVPPRPWNWIGLYPVGREAIAAPFFMRPPGARIVSYSILPNMGEFQYEQAIEMTSSLKDVDRILVGLGGKSYLSGNVGYDRAQWAEHYGEIFQQGIEWKREFDPNQVFHAAGTPFGDSPGPSAEGRD